MKRLSFFFLFLLAAGLSSFAQNGTRLLRFPAISEDQIVFTYAGDLYTVSSSGGVARKLTSDVGFESFARFSPDGKQIAFTGQYDGNTEVFVMPSEGGVPKRVTFTATLSRDDVSDRMGPNNIVMGWTPDGKYITYRSRKKSFDDFIGQLFNVSPNGGLSSELPLATGGFCSYSPDGSKLAFNRIFREFRTWKRYKGGMADEIWIYDFKTKKTDKITNNAYQDIIPMWHGNDIYFVSERTGTMNIFKYDLRSKETTQVTNFTDYDIKFPSIGKDAIVFENGGYIYKLDLSTDKYAIVPVTVADAQEHSRNKWVDASQDLTNGSLSPDGKRIAISARGEVFTVPAQKGFTKNLTQTSGVHERDAVWSPDGKNIAYISDKSGEFEIYLQDQMGLKPPVQITSGETTYKFAITWSPDSKKLLWSDQKMRLRMVDVSSKEITDITTCRYGRVSGYNFSPDSKWITYSAPIANDFNEIFLYSLDKKLSYEATDYWYSSDSPTFSADGKYLLFSSNRDFNPIYSETEWNHAYNNMGRIYLIMLSKNTPSPFAPENDVVTIAPDKAPAAKADKKDKKKSTEEVKPEVPVTKIDLDGIRDRIISLPTAPGYYGSISCLDDKVYYNYYNSNAGKNELKLYDLKKKEETVLGRNMSYEISVDQKKMLIMQNRDLSVIDLPSGPVSMGKTIDLSDMKVFVDYRQEWKQIYDECWRQMRDFFYMENMHGLDWKAIHDKYAVLLPYVNHRDDLTYLTGEMISELSIGHAYIESGEKEKPVRIETGLLGAQLSRDTSGYYRIDHILKGANWSKSLRSPLTWVGANIKEGDYILAVNGNPTNSMNDIYQSLVGKADKEVELTVNSSASTDHARNVIVVPIANEAPLYYYEWVENNTKKVDEATHGQIGYIHIPDMGPEGLNEFVEHFYPQLDKKGLIIDDRGNGGGNVSPMIIERLNRTVTRANMERNVEVPGHTPRQMMLGPKVLLVNYSSASDGDLFPYGFKKHKIGTVIGTRTWGGVVGIDGSLPFIDGADLRKPEFASYSSEESKWIIEGHGVDPDIVVDNDPAVEYTGVDQQLNKAIEVILSQLDQYKPIPPIPAAPDKSKKAFQ